MTELREIAFDTETTGLDWAGDDRIIELGAVELINHIPTGRTFQTYINPGRPVSDATIEITGITDEMLQDKPAFSDPSVVDAFLDFIGDAQLVAHNAAFDRGFLYAELARLSRNPIEESRWIDTVSMARKRHPGAPASLDALCKRYNINSDARTLHGALLDSQLLAEVYLELLGGRARSFDFGASVGMMQEEAGAAFARPKPLPPRITEEEQAEHTRFVDSLGGGDPIWKRFG